MNSCYSRCIMTHSIVTEIGLVSAVAFDMDGLMFDTERIMIDMWAKAASIHGWQLSEELLLSTVGVSAEGTRDMLVAECGPAFPHDSIRAERLRLEKEYFLARGVPLKRGLADLLEFLKRQGIPCGVATSTSGDRARDTLERAGVLGYFKAVLCGDEVVHCKPDPEIYTKLCDRLEVCPGQCLVLEDSRAGILAAHSAGCMPVMVPDLVAPDAVCCEKAVRIVDSLEEVQRWLAVYAVHI